MPRAVSCASSGAALGTNLAGTAASANGGGVRVVGFSHVIGGDDVGEGNLVSGNTDQGILVDGGSNNVIQGNRIGTNALGIGALPNTTGIEILSTDADDGEREPDRRRRAGTGEPRFREHVRRHPAPVRSAPTA